MKKYDSNTIKSALESYGQSPSGDECKALGICDSRAYLSGWINGATAGEYDLPFNGEGYHDWKDGFKDGQQYARLCEEAEKEDRETVPVMKAWQEVS